MAHTFTFTTGHGTLNDFVILDDPDGSLALDASTVAALADRRAGIGGDGVIRAVRTAHAGIEHAPDAPEWFMDYRNADGSIAEMCGNGVRVLAAHLRRVGHVDGDSFAIMTRAGVRDVEILAVPDDDAGEWSVRVGMGHPALVDTGRTLELGGAPLPVTDVDMGNPHAVAFLPEGIDLAAIDLGRRPALDPEPAEGANIELVSVLGPREVTMRVHERGVGETLSCGTGIAATAVAAAHHAADRSGRPWRVTVPGGTLEVGWTDDGEVTLTGPARLVADGVAHL